ncbi:hypothetical protein [Nocardia sp. CDC160]|uniref:hypothetical protein n=1 Tax=Nocardia sp. CDC160 TaxID=3112166 RepID=UPI002DBFD849|nr:hypothetical protein [Nocardia sp. CDC160]MEC3919319.1 hypothetical protein [Nocardia sp. CDC160]
MRRLRSRTAFSATSDVARRHRRLVGRHHRDPEPLSEAVHGADRERRTARSTSTGYRGVEGGRCAGVGRPLEVRGTTAQIVGLWPWAVGAGAPVIGTPLGPHLRTGAPVCFDPLNWFARAGLLSAPSLFVLGLNGFGKSSLVRRIVIGGVAQGITPLILADVKPDYRQLVEAVGGQVIDLGHGYGRLNPLDGGALAAAVVALESAGQAERAAVMRYEWHARQASLLSALIELVRGARVADYEQTVIATALRILHSPTESGGHGFTPDQPPVIDDLMSVIVTGGEDLRLDAAADTEAAYQEAIIGIRRSLRALTQGPFGRIFNGHTTTRIDLDATAICVDVSHIPAGDKKLKAAVMIACWATGFAAIEAHNALADAGLIRQRYFQAVMDELWQVLGMGEFMVDRVDELTRLQRGIACALIMISHTIKDLDNLGTSAAKALGFLERARAKIFGALPAEEILRLDSRVPFTATEREMVTSWSSPAALSGDIIGNGENRPLPPGTGKFLLKIGEDRRPGIPFYLSLTEIEREQFGDTNSRFHGFAAPRTEQERDTSRSNADGVSP